MAVTAPPLPKTWRPLGPRIVAVPFGLILVGAFVWLWLRFDDETKAGVSLWQRLTVIGLIGLGLAMLHAMARSRVTATEQGLEIVNGYRKRSLAWADAGTFRMPQGAPWPHLEFADESRLSLLGIQNSDGRRTEIAVRELRVLFAERVGPHDT